MVSALAYVAVRLTYVERYAHRHRCEGAGCRRTPAISIPGDTGWLWAECPVGLLCAPWWRALVGLHEATEIAPLSGWPDRYNAWAADGLRAIRRRQTDERARLQAEAMEGAS